MHKIPADKNDDDDDVKKSIESCKLMTSSRKNSFPAFIIPHQVTIEKCSTHCKTMEVGGKTKAISSANVEEISIIYDDECTGKADAPILNQR